MGSSERARVRPSRERVATRRRRGRAMGLVAVLCGCLSAPAQEADPGPGGIQELSRLDSEIQESSGLVASRTHQGVFWTHNDSGDEPRLFAIRGTGELLAEFSVEGAAHVDWEDIAIDDAGHLYVADFGNNRSNRDDLVVYRVREPNPRGTRRTVEVDRALPFRYGNQIPGRSPPDFDAEALVWHGGELFIFTKHRSDTRTEVFRLRDLQGAVSQVLEPLGSLEIGSGAGSVESSFARVTAADLSPDGRSLALLTYSAILLYARPPEGMWPLEPLRRISLSPLRVQQAESLAWDGGDALIFGNEQRQLFRIEDPLGGP